MNALASHCVYFNERSELSSWVPRGAEIAEERFRSDKARLMT